MSTIAPTVESLAARLAHLERTARRWKLAAVGLAVVMVGVVSMGAVAFGE